MFFRFRECFKFLPYLSCGNCYGYSQRRVHLLANSSNSSWRNARTILDRRVDWREFQGKMNTYSTVSATGLKPLSGVDFLSFLRSSLSVPEGSSHFWLNKAENSKNTFNEEGIFLVLAGGCLPPECTESRIFDKVKVLQQRHPFLQVLAVDCCKSIWDNDVSIRLLQKIINEYLAFPILLSKKNITEIADGPCYIIFRGFENPVFYREKDVDLLALDKAISDLNVQENKKPLSADLKSTWVKPIEDIKEPDICSVSQNILLSFPACISAEASGDHFFLSDANHHRIIVFNSEGKILDAIGSSPGFEDGEFETAKLLRPAASFYHDGEACLYFVDSENHAIRRADMEKRVVETVYPASSTIKESSSVWRWIVDKIWTKGDVDPKAEELSLDSFLFPWHVAKSSDRDLFVLNRSLTTLWIIDMASGVIKEVIKESSKILEICGQIIVEKCIPLAEMPKDWLQQQVDANSSSLGSEYASVMSSVATFEDHVIICDTVAQMILKFSRKGGSISSFKFSNFGILGLPYWLSASMERVYTCGYVSSQMEIDHVECFHLLPGKVEIDLNVDLPQCTELVEPLQEGCIWRQTRGTATEITAIEEKAVLLDKVGVAQSWYDEIDDLFFTKPQEVSGTEEESTPSHESVQEGRVDIGCTVNTSPGTSEVIIDAAIYLRLRKGTISNLSQEKKAAKIADLLDPTRRIQRSHIIKLLTASNRDLEELIFIRPLHVKVKFDCPNHPKAENSKDIIVTDSSVKVHVTL